jgi:hypothetical protein
MASLPGRRRHALVAALVFALGGTAACSADVPPPRAGAVGTSDGSAAVRPAGFSELVGRPRTAGVWPGATGLSGVNGDPVIDRAHVERFCSSRGRACEVAQTYTDRTSYAAMTGGTGWTFANFDGFPGALVVSQGLVPEGRPGDLAGCAAGDFDSQWRDFGTLMVAHGRGDSVIRLGWEFNGDFMAWAGTDAGTWIACYRRAVDGIRATNPAALFDWTINAHHTPAEICGGLSTNCYPGDDYVDIIGIDNYDHFPPSATAAAFRKVAAAPEGLDWLYAFARRHGKLFSVGEWGVVADSGGDGGGGGGGGGGDSAAFIRWMHAWFAAHAPHLAYEAYFSGCSESPVQSSLFRTDTGCTLNPRSAQAYRELFGP